MQTKPEPLELEENVVGSHLKPAVPPTQEPYNAAKANDDARRNIAYRLIYIAAGVVLFAFIILLFGIAFNVDQNMAKQNYDHLIGVLNIVFGPIMTLLGSATGFYFGSQTRDAGAKDPSKSHSHAPDKIGL